MKKATATFLFIVLSITIFAQGYLHRDGKNIVEGNGNEIILRGIGLGGWMLQEPYMLQVSATNQKDFRTRLEKLMGAENTNTFYTTWLTNYMQKKDVDSLAAWGFNSIRLPMHYNLFTLPIEKEPVAGENTWLDAGFKLTDSLLSWCKSNKIYLILDMHATPGGQGKDAAISDYDSKLSSLWQNDTNKTKLIALWKKLADRYKNEEWIGGYDLINEPNWDFENSGNQNGCNCNSNAPLLQIYKDLITEIRKIDTNHMVIVEGNCWGNRYNGMNSIASFDNNLALSFHKYWSYNNYDAISGIINLRNSLNVPIWCGETGENSNAWFTSAIQLFEKNKIGWAWWTFKKFESTSGINSVKQTSDYIIVTNYIKNGGTAPTGDFTKNALLQMAENIKLENCITNYSVIDAMFRQVKTSDTKQYGFNKIPGTIFCSDYDYGRYKIAYADNDTADLHVSIGGDFTAWNSGYAYRNDGVDIEACTDKENNNGFSVGWTAAGEWTQYTVNVDSTAAYKLYLRYAGQNPGTKMHLSADNYDITGAMKLKTTGGWQTWKTDTFDNIVLEKGVRALKLFTDSVGSNLNYFKLEYSKKIEETPFKIISGSIDESGSKIFLTLNMECNMPFDAAPNDFIITVNNTVLEGLPVSLDVNGKLVILNLNSKLSIGDVVKISYVGSSIKNKFNIPLEIINDLIVRNLSSNYLIPTKIEAENYITQSGLTAETCSEGGLSMGYTNAGDYLDYNVTIKNAGSYKVEFRISAQNAGGSIELQLYDGTNKTILGTFSVPATGGWQNWQTISGNISLPAGSYKLRVFVKSAEFNFNWFSFSKSTLVGSVDNKNNIRLYPVPCDNFLTVETNSTNPFLRVADVTGRLCAVNTSFSKPGYTEIDTRELKRGLYFIYLDDLTEKFIVSR